MPSARARRSRAHGERVGVLEAERADELHAVAVRARSRRPPRAPRARSSGSSAALHDRGPDRARVVDVDVDLAAAQGVERHRGAQGLDDPGRPAGLALDLPARISDRMYCSVKVFAPTVIGTRSPDRGRRRERRRPRRSTHSAASSPPATPIRRRSRSREAALEQPDQAVQRDRERGRRDAAHQHGGEVARLQPAEDVVAEALGADGRGEGGGPHHPDRGGADARDDHRQRQRQLARGAGAGARSSPRRAPPRPGRRRPR